MFQVPGFLPVSLIETQLKLNEQLKRHEGIRYSLYKCSAGKWTIGVGRNLSDNGISEQEAEFMLTHDIEDAAISASKLPFWSNLSQVRRAAFINLSFNLGMPRLLKFKRMLKAAGEGKWTEASLELLDSRYAKQVGRRADELAEQLRTGEWQF